MMQGLSVRHFAQIMRHVTYGLLTIATGLTAIALTIAATLAAASVRKSATM